VGLDFRSKVPGAQGRKGNDPRFPLQDMEPRVVHLQRPEFADFKISHFRDCLRDLRRQIIEKNNSAASDSAALARDRLIYPKATHNHRGEPQWDGDGSKAEQLLRKDMDEGKHDIMKPMDLYESRKDYYDDYPLGVFRGHIHQEAGCRKYFAFRSSKSNKNKNS
jgi:hypothetical protein